MTTEKDTLTFYRSEPIGIMGFPGPVHYVVDKGKLYDPETREEVREESTGISTKKKKPPKVTNRH